MKSFVFFLCLIAAARALDNGLALTPPMGWMTWERYRCTINCTRYPGQCLNEELIIEMADIMVKDGYLDAGYNYLNIDDCWSELERDENNKLVADRERFPRGKKYIADYVHGKGLKFGTYLDYGTTTCAGYPGSQNFLEIDAQSLADWEVDFIKMDGCAVDNSVIVDGYIQFADLMNKTGRPIVFSCSWPAYFEFYRRPIQYPDYEVLKKTCNLWRNWEDIDDSYESMISISEYFADNQDRLIPAAGPGHWNDPDTLLLGTYGLSYDQSKAQLAIWASIAAPFLLSNDLRTITPKIKALILNKEVIAVDQDPLGIQGRVVSDYYRYYEELDIWVRDISPKIDDELSHSVAYVSRRADGHPFAFNITLKELKLNHEHGYSVKDLFNPERADFKFLQSDSVEERVNPTGANFYRFTPISSSNMMRASGTLVLLAAISVFRFIFA